jgi:hypothetical protein
MLLPAAGWRAVDRELLGRVSEGITARSETIARYFPENLNVSAGMHMINSDRAPTRTIVHLTDLATALESQAARLRSVDGFAPSCDAIAGSAATLRQAADELRGETGEISDFRSVQESLKSMTTLGASLRRIADIGALPESSEAADARLMELVAPPFGRHTDDDIRETATLVFDIPKDVRPNVRLKTFGTRFDESLNEFDSVDAEMNRLQFLTQKQAEIYTQLRSPGADHATRRFQEIIGKPEPSVDELYELRALVSRSSGTPWMLWNRSLWSRFEKVDFDVATDQVGSVAHKELQYVLGSFRATNQLRTRDEATSRLRDLLSTPVEELTAADGGELDALLFGMSAKLTPITGLYRAHNEIRNTLHLFTTGQRIPLNRYTEPDWVPAMFHASFKGFLAELEVGARGGFDATRGSGPERLAELGMQPRMNAADAMEAHFLVQMLGWWDALPAAVAGDREKLLDLAINVARGQMEHFGAEKAHLTTLQLALRNVRDCVTEMPGGDPMASSMKASVIEKLDRSLDIITQQSKDSDGYQNFPNYSEISSTFAQIDMLRSLSA